MALVQKLLGYGFVFGVSSLSFYKFMTRRVFDRSAIVAEPPSTSIVMCALNEEFFIETALESLEDQNVRRKYPEKFELILVDSNSEDRTVEIAESYGWTVYQAERGKLTARDLGMRKARGEVVVSVDCDTRYGANWLNLMLRWFRFTDVVGVVGPRLADPQETSLGSALSVWLSLADVGPLLLGGMRMPGQSVAFYRQAYFDVGGWDLSINQRDVHQMVREEEIRFAWKLRRLGRVIVDWQAPVFTSARRAMFLGKGKKYREWTKARLHGERF